MPSIRCVIVRSHHSRAIPMSDTACPHAGIEQAYNSIEIITRAVMVCPDYDFYFVEKV